MSALTIDHDLVHYEVLGRGRPVILLHGWLGSWRYWIPAMQQISVRYRTYALDLWGFGESAKEPRLYGFEAQVRLLAEFMERLGISKAALVGHGLGAAIATRYALRAPDRVPRLMAISPPLFWLPPPAELPVPPPGDAVPGRTAAPVDSEAETIGLRTEEMNARLRAAFEREAQRQAAPETGASVEPPAPRPNPLRDRFDPLDALALLQRHADPGANLNKLLAEVRKADPAAFAATVESLAGVDTLRELQRLALPVLAVFGGGDTLLPAPDEAMLRALRDGDRPFHTIEMRGLRHFPMLDDIAAFNRLLMDFLETADVRQVSIKERWERRVR